MSTIFELGYEFSDPLEKEIFLIERTADIALRRVFDLMDMVVLTEASSEKGKEEYSGLIGLIRKGFKIISDMLGSIIDRLKSFIGLGENRKVKFDKDPKKTVEIADKAIGEDIDALSKITNGKMSLDQVKNMVDEHANLISAVGPFVGMAASLGIGILADKNILGKWRSQLDQACSRNTEELSQYAERLARTGSYVNKQDVIKEASQYLINDIHMMTGKGSNAFMRWVQAAYVKRKVGERLGEEAKSLTTVSGGIKYRMKERLTQKTLDREAEKLEKQKSRVEKNTKANQKEKNRTAEARQRRDNAAKDYYLDAPKKYDTKEEVANSLRHRTGRLNYISRTKETPDIEKIKKERKEKNSLHGRLDRLNALSQQGVDKEEITDRKSYRN